MNICIIDKAPSRNDYSKYFDFKFEVHHMSSVPITKLLKKDVTLDIDLDLYDLVILVGSEAAKHYAKITSVTNYAGQLVDDKFVCINNPAILIFKPEGKNDFEKSVERVKGYAAGKKADKATGDYGGIDDVRYAKEYLLEVLNNAEVFVAIDTEGTALYPRDGYVLGFSISYKIKQGRYILTDVLDDDNLAIIQQIIDKYEIVLHNMKYDIKMIEYHTNLRFRRGHVHDTMLMHYALDENGQHGLKLLALKYTDFGDYDAALEEFKVQYCKLHGMLQEDFTYDLIPFDIMWPYASMDTAVTLELCYKFLPLIRANTKLNYVYNNLLVPGTLFLNDVEEVGIPIHKARMQAAEVHLDEEILKAKEYLYTFDDLHRFEKDQADVFNPGSVVQLRKLLFDYIGLTPTGKLTKGGAVSTDSEVLEELSDEHPLPKAILNIRQLTKRKNTYISKILPELDRDSRIRTNFNMIFTTSGRLSSSGKFNAQQIERDDPLVKGCIHAPEGYSIVSQDLSTGEVYYAAVLSGDLALQQVFKDGGDFHSAIAKSVFDLTCEVKDVKKLYPGLRQASKAITFGILYGSGASKVSATVTKETGEPYGLDRAEEDIASYFRKFHKLKRWLDSRKEFIKANGFTYSFFGRKRRLINVFSADKGIAAHEVRSGINSEIQSLCSDINLLGAIDTANELKSKNLDARVFMLVHDSIVALVRDDLVDQYCEIVKRNTQKDRGCSIKGQPIGVDQDIGKDYSFGKFEDTYRFDGNTLSRI